MARTLGRAELNRQQAWLARWTPLGSRGDAPDTLDVIGVDARDTLFAVKRGEVGGVGQPALSA